MPVVSQGLFEIGASVDHTLFNLDPSPSSGTRHDEICLHTDAAPPPKPRIPFSP